MFGAGIILAIMFFIVIVACIIMIIEDKATAGKVGVLILCVLLFIGSLIMIFVGAGSASTKRKFKDISSDLTGGIHREICITAEDGREIYYYEGTIDLEIDGEQRKIKFEDESGNRQIIIYGVQDTVTIIEK